MTAHPAHQTPRYPLILGVSDKAMLRVALPLLTRLLIVPTVQWQALAASSWEYP